MPRKLILCLGLILALTLLANFVIYTKQNQVRETTAINEHTYKVIAASNKLVEAMVNQETGFRGYLLTADRAFLAPYTQGSADFDKAIDEARGLTSDNPQQQTRLAQVAALARRWRSEVAERNIALMGAPATQAAARASMLDGTGKALMDELRTRVGSVIGTERSLLATRSASQAAAFSTIIQTILGSMILGVVLSIGMGLLMTRAIARPLERVTAKLGMLADPIATDLMTRSAGWKAASPVSRRRSATSRASLANSRRAICRPGWNAITAGSAAPSAARSVRWSIDCAA
nr:CHASE3 domain-containing protein [Sphingomonas melonis]